MTADIPVKLFREILIWPLALVLDAGQTARVGAEQVRELLRKQRERTPADPAAWQPVDDPRLHILPAADGPVRSSPDRGGLPFDAFEEVVYFHPFVQRFLFQKQGAAGSKRRCRKLSSSDSDPAPALHLYRRTDIKQIVLTLPPAYGQSQSRRFRLKVDRINLYLFDLGLVVLAVEVSSEDGRAAVPLPLFPTLENTESMTVADVQDILSRLRRAYPPFWPGGLAEQPGDCPSEVAWLRNGPGDPEDRLSVSADTSADLIDCLDQTQRPPAFAHWRELLKPLQFEAHDDCTAPEVPRLRHVMDERIPTMLLLGVEEPAHIHRNDWIRLCFADGPDNGPPYAPDFLDKFEEKHAYDRFWQNGEGDHTTRFLCCGYNMAVIGKARTPETWTFLRNVLQKHFRRHYFQLGLINHFQKAALLTLSDAVSDAIAGYSALDEPRGGRRTEAPRRQLRSDVEELQKRVLTLTHRYWFTDVSNHVQAQDLFTWWKGHLGTQAVFDQVTREVAESNQFLDAHDQNRMARSASQLNRFAGAGLIFGLTTGALGMNVLVGGKDGYQTRDMVEVATVLAFFLLLAQLYWIALDWLDGKKAHGWRRRLATVVTFGFFCASAVILSKWDDGVLWTWVQGVIQAYL